jgi:uncharacterized protein
LIGAECAWLSIECIVISASAIGLQWKFRLTHDRLSIAMDFIHLSLSQILLVAVTAVTASVVGGLAGYGTGLILPLVLVPIIGAEATVPVIGVSALFTNVSRAVVFRKDIAWRKVLIAWPAALSMAVLAASFFTSLNERGASAAIGSFLLASVPLRRALKGAGYALGEPGLALADGVYGAVTGMSTGAGVILISILMAAGLTGTAVVATDAAISIGVGLAKTSTFGVLGALPPRLLLLGLLTGCATCPAPSSPSGWRGA